MSSSTTSIEALEKWQDVTSEEIRNTYAGYAKWIHRLRWLNLIQTAKYRRRQFSSATGRVLDVACGTGLNFRYIPESAQVVGIDLTHELLDIAQTELNRLDRDGVVEQMDAQTLAFAADSFDTVISSFSTCTFPDPIAALQEMERVCKPDGRILLLEHGKVDIGPLAKYQEWRADSSYHKYGCRLMDDPTDVVREAGLSVDESDSWQFGRFTTIAAHPS